MGDFYVSPLETRVIGYMPSYMPSLQFLAKFRKWHVEALLNQAADLLDRCLRDRLLYHDMRARWDLLELERKETELGQRLIDDQVAAGSLTLESEKLNRQIQNKGSLNPIHQGVVNETYEYYKPLPNPPARAAMASHLQA